MFKHRLEESTAGKVIFLHWFLLSFNAGCINAGGFLAAGKFVTHVTGFATLFGVDVANNHTDAALGILSVPLFFLGGAVIAGLLVDARISKGKQPHFDYVMLISSLCLGIAAIAGHFEKFGVFGIDLHISNSYVLLALLCLASGLQNAAITSSSRSSVRTTHLTGLITDLGLGLARLVTLKKTDPKIRIEVKANWLRIGTICFFIVGSVVGAILFLKSGYLGFLLPCAIDLYSAVHGRMLKNHVNRQ